MEQSLIYRFKRLPEAKKVPDEVWECEKLQTIITEYRSKITLLELDLTIAAAKMVKILRQNWTDKEIRAAGLMPMTGGDDHV